jgi:hypothetical protein
MFRAVIQIEPAEEILVGLPPAGVLRDGHARHHLKEFAAAEKRTQIQLLSAALTLRGAGSLAKQTGRLAFHHHLRQRLSVGFRLGRDRGGKTKSEEE